LGVSLFSLLSIVASRYVLTTHVTVFVCHAELKGYLFTYLCTDYLQPKFYYSSDKTLGYYNREII